MADIDPLPEALNLTREAILAGDVMRVARQVPGMILLSEAELAASLAATLARGPGIGDIWVFCYGSLIWNPAFIHDAQRVGRIRGRHRRFCLWTEFSRGCPQRPGLTLGLDRGGTCHGVAYRIPAAATGLELALLWRREMVSGAYVPRWVTVETDQSTIPALTFAIDQTHPRYAGKLDDTEIAGIIACAVGRMGSCADYLFKTVAALEGFGIRDKRMEALKAQVETLERA